MERGQGGPPSATRCHAGHLGNAKVLVQRCRIVLVPTQKLGVKLKVSFLSNPPAAAAASEAETLHR